MKVLGIRNSPTKIRFAIIEGDKSSFAFINSNDENKIELPKSAKTEFEKFEWIKSEFERIFDKYGPFDHMAIKQNENVPGRYSSLKPVMFLDCIATMVSIKNHTQFSSVVYTTINTKSKEVVKYVENLGLKSNINWDQQMADAIAVSVKIIAQ